MWRKCFLLKRRCFKEFELTHIFLTVYLLNKNKNWWAFLLPPKMLKSLGRINSNDIYTLISISAKRGERKVVLYTYITFSTLQISGYVYISDIFSCLKVAIQWNLSLLSITTMSLITQYIACYLANAFITGNGQKVLMSA